MDPVARLLIALCAALLGVLVALATFLLLRAGQVRRDLADLKGRAAPQPCRRLHAADLPASLLRLPVHLDRARLRETVLDEERVRAPGAPPGR